MSTSQSLRLSTAPYPGLRSFLHTEADIFFGREEQTDQLLKKLQETHFVSVIGPSGCGKSSLVRAGMISALSAGLLTRSGAYWRVAEMRPGDRPLTRLAEALTSPLALGPETGTEPEATARLQAMLRRGRLGLLEALRETPLPKHANLLILVDQFEEIFRFRREGDSNEADAFVALLLASAQQTEIPINVVITMRSEYLGDSALFTGLPEAINDGQFLTPRMTRAQCEAAITIPARVFGGSVDPALVNRLLNEMSSDPDQLPLLQHCLMRMWTKATNIRQANQAQTQANGNITITLDDYRDIGALEEALSVHADEVLQSLTTEQQLIAQTLFRRLTERVAGRGDRRRPSKLRDVAEVAGVSDEDVAAVVKAFRRSDRSFLTPPPEVRLTKDTFLDITHESLITFWHTLTGWVDDEARSAAAYDRLKKTAQDWPKDAELLGGVNLERALEWRNKQRPTVFWARRYGTDEEFAQTIKFLDASEKAWKVHMDREADRERLERENEIERKTLTAKAKFARRLQFLTTALALVAILAVVAALFAVSASRAANEQRLLAEKNLEEAKTQREEAEKQKNFATIAASDASTQKAIAEDNRKAAIAQADLASRRERDARQAEAEALKAQAESDTAKKA
ncbi:MAG TPA: AAA family ATPase, partial [Pyrinomonadaceae bacterium]|nr:AAA family ATPase [Pyrinomonadaceae bacterium]